MKVRSAGREAAEDWPLDLADMVKPAIDQRLAKIGCGLFLARDLVSNGHLRQVAYVQTAHIDRWRRRTGVAGSNIQRRRERMVADSRRVVAGAAGSVDNRNAASNEAPSRLVVIQSSHSCDVNGLGIEQSLTACDGGAGIIIGESSPCIEAIEDRRVKRSTGWILKGGDLGIDPDKEGLVDEGFGSPGSALRAAS